MSRFRNLAALAILIALGVVAYVWLNPTPSPDDEERAAFTKECPTLAEASQSPDTLIHRTTVEVTPDSKLRFLVSTGDTLRIDDRVVTGTPAENNARLAQNRYWLLTQPIPNITGGVRLLVFTVKEDGECVLFTKKESIAISATPRS